ncbi:unnamed protein product [Mytilus coruscus]|uniref:CYP49A n=1 Tax=Mytilus coruscus TaxID=42192 RepID=A0A6J8DJI5_MYTCO|nr:unnamed protein product [Mytilus coruscus]
MTTTCCQRYVGSQIRKYVSCRFKATMAAILAPEYETEHVKSFEDIPGPPSLPFVGALVNHFPCGAFHGKTPPQIYEMCRQKYGDIYKERIFHFSFVHVFDPDDFETVFRADGKYPIREAFMTLTHFNRKYNGNVQGIITSQNETWQKLRSTFQQKMLRPKAVAAYFDEQSRVADELVEKISRTKCVNGIVEDIRSDLTKFATEGIGLVCFNKRFDLLLSKEENAEARQFLYSVRVIMDTTHNEFRRLPFYKLFETPSYKEFVKAKIFVKEMANKYSKQALKEMEERSKDGTEVDGENGDLIPYLMSKSSLTEEEVFKVISEFILVGVDTTSHHIAYMLYLLGTHPDVQEKLHEEMSRHIDKTLSIENLQQMTYLKAVDKEVHRLLPVAGGTIRRLTQDINLRGYHIPAGTTVAVHWEQSMLDEVNFKDAHSFKPERWLRDNVNRKEIHPFAAIPFGVGQRSCIGRRFAEQETFLAVVKILQSYRVQYVGEDLKLDYGVNVAPATKMRFQFTPRNPKD